MCNVVSVTAKPLCKDDFLQKIQKISDSDTQYIILREKYLSEQEYFNLAKNVLSVCDKDKLIIHNFPETAVKLGVKKIHLPFGAFKDLKGREVLICSELPYTVRRTQCLPKKTERITYGR